ncbi:DUF6520 family protein [Puia dinghuensis]|uniref:Uncharacterized protein n=1 Tax=Puia dinghuensis TaxID=1792502 RepID=A0A8J2UB64_9BACT|nr:DUF6520 family protein [Puia dinghuensis]GGA92142.1 hypothetical protein GCM10011511_14400 [Puia dinghuensis]
MKKIKWSILSLTVVFAITAAFTSKPHFDCTTFQQYYFNGSSYIPVSAQYGCAAGSQFCTYYTTNGGITYTGCTIGTYNGCMGCAVEAPKTK